MSCFKQDAPEISSDRERTVRDRDQLKACSDITFYEGFLSHKNVFNLFVCTSWDRKFTQMFSAIKEISPQDWNTILAPIDAIFFADRERRDRFIKYYRDLDNDGALDDLGRVITALTDTNFYNGLNQLFKCAEEPTADICKNRSLAPTKDEIKNFFDILNRNPKLLLELALVIDNFNEAAREDSETLRDEINKFNSTDFFNSLRIMMVSQAATKYIEGLSESDLKIIQRFFMTKTVDGIPWIKSWIAQDSVSYDYLYEVFSLPVLEQSQLVRDIKVLNSLYSNNVKCDNTELTLEIDIKSLVHETLSHLTENEVPIFNDKMLMAIESTRYAKPFCPEVINATRVVNYWEYSQRRNVNHTLDLTNTLTYTSKLMSHDQTIELVKYVLDMVDSDYDYLVELMSSELFNVSNEVNRVVIENAAPFYKVLLRILKKSDAQMYKSLAVLSNDVFDKAQSKDLMAWSKVWLFWNKEEQNFLFNFIDRHLDSNTNYIRLFEFYSLAFKEVSSSWEVLRDAYIKDEDQKEATYQAFKNFSKVFHGENILADYKKFFSRDHLLELLRVITSGGSYTSSRITDLSIMIDSDYDQLPVRSFSLEVNASNSSSTTYLCAKALNDANSLQDLLVNYPTECSGLSSNFAMRDISEGINNFFKIYSENYPKDSIDNFFEIGGLLSPEMSVWAIASAVGLSESYNRNGSSLKSAFSFFNKYIFNIGSEGKKAIDILTGSLSVFTKWLSGDEGVIFRNSMIRKLATNKSDVSELSDMLEGYILDYDSWSKEYKQSEYIEDESYSCKKFLNTSVGPNVCPSDVAVKKNLKNLVAQLSTQYEESEGRPIDYILDASVYNGGVDIPLDHSNAKKKRLTLLETFNYLYDLSDKSRSVNRVKVKHRASLNSDKNKYELTTSERIDLVIRNVAFDYNYLGVQYLNSVVKGDDYTDTVKDKHKLMKLCVNAPVVRCGKKMSKNERRMARNALWAYDGLIDVNNGNGLDKKLQYGKYMQTFLLSLVGSSAKKAQEVTFWPLDKDLLKKHNGRALGYFSEIASFSNMGRAVHDRVGRTKEELSEFLNKKQFRRVDRFLMANANGPKLKKTFVDLFEILNNKSEGESLIDNSVDWINTLSYEELRLAEELVSKTLYLSTYLGSERFALGTGNDVEFKENSVYELLEITTQLIKYHASIKKQFDRDLNLKDAISPTLSVISFFYDMLSRPEKRRDYWYLFNLSYSALKTSMYESYGTKLLVENVIQKKEVSRVANLIVDGHGFLDQVHTVGFTEIAANVKILNDSNVESDIAWDYLKKTTVSDICPLEGDDCEKNENYDQVFKLVTILERDDNLQSLLEWVLIEKSNNFIRTSKEFFPYIKIK
jgi:hypothetical protein